jgi:hypothetical protein
LRLAYSISSRMELTASDGFTTTQAAGSTAAVIGVKS